MEETSASLEEMSSITHSNAEYAAHAEQLAQKTKEASNQGNMAMEEMRSAIHDVHASSEKTAKIIKSIDEIATCWHLTLR